MTSNAHRGAYYKWRSQRWLQKRGFQVASMEVLRTIWTNSGVVCTKRDTFGSDLMYFTDDVVVFVQVKGGLKTLNELTKQARKTFDKYKFPLHSRQELHVWRPRARAPEIVIMSPLKAIVSEIRDHAEGQEATAAATER